MPGQLLEDLKEHLALCQRIEKANSCLQKTMNVEDQDLLRAIQQQAAESPKAREEERTTAASAGEARASTSGRSIDANQSLVMSVCRYVFIVSICGVPSSIQLRLC